ncbi:MAG: hypothetical protein LBJ08_06395, partial [Bifidobacteriaceae bacterium]|nr:hypothetical protein [Bifidobacteriaceae bacterium]
MTRTANLEDLYAIVQPSQPALSPDGHRVAYALTRADRTTDTITSALWVADAGQPPRALTHGPGDTSPAWAPDGSRLAFVRDGQLWLLPAGGGEPEQVTDLPLGVGAPVWSPDGQRIAFAAPVARGPAAGGAAQRAAAPIVADGLGYQADGDGFIAGMWLQVHVVDVADGRVRQLTDAPAHATSPAWAPDGTHLVFVARPAGQDDLSFRSAVHRIDATQPKARPRVVAFAGGHAGTCSYTPDGDHLVVVGWTGEPVGNAGLFLVDLTGARPPRNLAAGLDRNLMPGAPGYPGALPQFTADGGTVVFAVRDAGCT